MSDASLASADAAAASAVPASAALSQSTTVAVTVLVGLLSLSIFALRSYLRKTALKKLPGALAPTGTVRLERDDFGNDAEMARDNARNLASRAIRLLPAAAGGALRRLEAVEGESALETLRLALRQQFPDASDGAVARAASHLTVNPGMAVLTKSACAPMLLQNCYLVACRRGELRVLTLGFTGAPADVTKTGPRPEQKAAPFVLIVGSPNLLVGDDGDGLACTVTYQARRAASASIEAELDALVGRIDADYDGLS